MLVDEVIVDMSLGKQRQHIKRQESRRLSGKRKGESFSWKEGYRQRIMGDELS